MDWIDWGDAPAWAGTAIALAAMVYTIIKARGAKESGEVAERQAKAAESSAEAAGQSVGAAERAATAAEDQASAARRAVEAAEAQAAEARKANELAQEALEHERAERHEASGPDFTLTPGRRSGLVHSVQVTMTGGGPYQVDVEVTWVSVPDGHWVNHEDDSVGGLHAENVGPHVMTRGSTFELAVQVRERYEPYQVIVHFECREIAQGPLLRQWTRSAAATLKPPGRMVAL